jgi:hypothetical protein
LTRSRTSSFVARGRVAIIAGTGFGLTEPHAVEALADAGAVVRLFVEDVFELVDDPEDAFR